MIVSHDVEFCADYATDCALLFDGNLIGADAANCFLRTIILYACRTAVVCQRKGGCVMRKARDVSYRRKFDLKQVEKRRISGNGFCSV